MRRDTASTRLLGILILSLILVATHSCRREPTDPHVDSATAKTGAGTGVVG